MFSASFDSLRVFLIVLVCLLPSACGNDPAATVGSDPDASATDVRRLSGRTMGTYYNLTLVAAAGERFGFDDETMQAAIDAQLRVINQHLSTYIADSELMRFNAADVDQWHAISEPLHEVLRIGHRISELTDGAFDVTVGPLVNLWGFGPDPERQSLPDGAEIEELLQRVGYRFLEIDGPQARKRAPIFVDLSGVAKGYGVDWLSRYLETAGIVNFLVDIGGDLRVRGLNPDGVPWRIAVETPSAERSGIQQVANISDVALVTSGDYRNFREQDGQRRSHIIDPVTGRPVDHTLTSVTVIAATAAEADALATGLMVMGTQAALELAEREGIAVFLIERHAGEFEETYSSAFTPYL